MKEPLVLHGVVQLRGDELGEWDNIKELRLKARDYAQAFTKKSIVNQATQHSILMTNQGVRHTISGAGDQLLRSIPAIPQLLAVATLLRSEPDKNKDPNIFAVEKYLAHLLIDGQNHVVILTVKHYQDGRRYYDHGIVS